MPFTRSGIRLVLAACLVPASPVIVDGSARLEAQEHEHDPPHQHALHFTHPLFAESVSPDTKLRLDYARTAVEAGPDEEELELEGEYALAPFFSVEIGLHYELDHGALGDTHVIGKLASARFRDAGVLLGGGLELGLPTGSEAHAHEDAAGHPEPAEDVYAVAPFVNGGWTARRWELAGWTLYEIRSARLREHVGSTLRYHASALYHAGRHVDALVEGFGRAAGSGPDGEDAALSVAPGIRLRPVADRPLVLGAALALPVTGEPEVDARVLVSAFYHF